MVQVQGHDCLGPPWGQAIADGVYDLAGNEGRGSVGVDRDTAPFAAASVLRWWRAMGRQRFPRAGNLMLLADGGGSNTRRNRLGKVALQSLADERGFPPQVCRFPPGPSKWTKKNAWAGKPVPAAPDRTATSASHSGRGRCR